MHASALLVAVADHVLARTGRDLSAYRAGTVGRRVALHMARLGCPGPSEYLAHLAREPREVDALAALVSIKVSRFFRVRRTWDLLASSALPSLARTAGDRPLRAWAAGCATGEEAYSLAWLFADAGAALHPLSGVLATDVDGAALDAAARALYHEPALAELDPARRARLERRGEAFLPPRPVRHRVRFGLHDLLRDAPPEGGGFDLLLCRNVLIYFARERVAPIQRRLAAALRPGGMLVLGESEALDRGLEALLHPLDRAARLYVRSAVPAEEAS